MSSSPASVLGINFGTHDAAAAIVVDGQVVAAAEEERFTRVKHTKAFPTNAAAFCVAAAGLTPREIERVALFVSPWLQLMLPVANAYYGFPESLGSIASDLVPFLQRLQLPRIIRESRLTGPAAEIVPVRHHLAHAASAYLTSPFEDATVVTIDGRGEYETACVFEGKAGRLRRRHGVSYPHSIGYLYSMVTRYLGFRPQRDEYKVMGLSAYGGPAFVKSMAQIASFDSTRGVLRLDLSFFDHHRTPRAHRNLFSDKFVRVFGSPRDPESPIEDRHRDIAHAVQRITEGLVLGYLRYAKMLAPSQFLCMAGGVALNAVANAAVIESGLFDNVFIQPAANDAGTSIGAALTVAAQASPRPLRYVSHDVLLGPMYSPEHVASAVSEATSAGCGAERVADPYASAASLLSNNRIIGWYRGRMEFGPRALGARSILAGPADPANKVRVNSMIKQRESFRPLAPAVLEERAAEYFVLHDAGKFIYPFMLATAPTVAARRSEIPAVVHVDGTARVQSVSRTGNPSLWHLITRFEELTGVPLLLNTSFNGADEPIVCTPSDAVRTFLNCGLDALVMDDWVITRADRE